MKVRNGDRTVEFEIPTWRTLDDAQVAMEGIDGRHAERQVLMLVKEGLESIARKFAYTRLGEQTAQGTEAYTLDGIKAGMEGLGWIPEPPMSDAEVLAGEVMGLDETGMMDYNREMKHIQAHQAAVNAAAKEQQEREATQARSTTTSASGSRDLPHTDQPSPTG